MIEDLMEESEGVIRSHIAIELLMNGDGYEKG